MGGGGAKGAYHAGVLRALEQAGVQQFECIAGTSIGSLNAVLVASGNADEAEQTWRNLSNIFRKSHQRSKALAYYALVYAVIFLPFVLTLLFFGALVFSGYIYHFGDFVWAQDALKWSMYGVIFSVVGLIILTYHARTAEMAGMTISFSFTPQKAFVVAAITLTPVAWANYMINPIGFKETMWCAGIAIVLWHAWTFGMIFSARRARSFSIYKNDAAKEIIEKQLRSLARRCRAKTIFATIAKERVYTDARYITDPDSEQMKQGGHLQGHPGKLFTRWCPEYVDLLSLGYEERLSTLLDTSAIPIAFPMRKDYLNRWICDGGIVDSFPIAAAINLSECDLVIAAPLNQDEYVEMQELQGHCDEKWAQSIIPDLTLEQKEAWISAAEEAGSWEATIPRRRLIGGCKVLWIVPSRPLATVNIPFISFLYGTLNFNPQVLERWMKQGFDDTNNALRDFQKAYMQKNAEASADPQISPFK